MERREVLQPAKIGGNSCRRVASRIRCCDYSSPARREHGVRRRLEPRSPRQSSGRRDEETTRSLERPTDETPCRMDIAFIINWIMDTTRRNKSASRLHSRAASRHGEYGARKTALM